MRALQTTIDFVARSSAPVLIAGETGAGKDLVAHAIHARSARSHQLFVAVNTSAIPQELLEAEIFGHMRGAFTAAPLREPHVTSVLTYPHVLTARVAAAAPAQASAASRIERLRQ
jgi:transcriptional regulator of aromatic amino acid metabolism